MCCVICVCTGVWVYRHVSCAECLMPLLSSVLQYYSIGMRNSLNLFISLFYGTCVTIMHFFLKLFIQLQATSSNDTVQCEGLQ